MNEMTIQEYILAQRPEIQPRLEAMRALLRAAAPEAEERFSWGMPTFFQLGNVVSFAAHAHHLGFCPGPEAIEAFGDELRGYAYSKGAVQFPYALPLPEAWIRQVVDFRIRENRAIAERKPPKKSASK